MSAHKGIAQAQAAEGVPQGGEGHTHLHQHECHAHRHHAVVQALVGLAAKLVVTFDHGAVRPRARNHGSHDHSTHPRIHVRGDAQAG